VSRKYGFGVLTIRLPDGYVFEGRQGREKGFYRNLRFNAQPDDEVFRIPEELK
jgi:hypothetical protein